MQSDVPAPLSSIVSQGFAGPLVQLILIVELKTCFVAAASSKDFQVNGICSPSTVGVSVKTKALLCPVVCADEALVNLISVPDIVVEFHKSELLEADITPFPFGIESVIAFKSDGGELCLFATVIWNLHGSS